MKKTLYGTTALVAAGFAMGAAAPASAAEKIKLGVSGYARYYVMYVDQSDGGTPAGATNTTTGIVSPQSGNADLDIKNNGEIWFKGSTKLDNGISIGVDVQFESFQSGDQVDEQYMFIQSPTLGRLIIGDENGAGYLMHIWSLGQGVHIDTGTVASVGAYQNTTGGTFFNSPLGNTQGRALDNDGAKITYISPRLHGVQLGVSYSPRFNEDVNAGANNAVAHNGWEGAVQYKTEVDGVGIGVMGAYKYANGQDTIQINTAKSDIRNWKINGELSYAGFRLSGGYLQQLEGLIAAGNSLAGHSYIVNLSYSAGPWGVSTGLFHGEQEDLLNTPGNDEHDKWIVEGRYAIGPGINVVGGVFGFDLTAEGTAVQQEANGELDNDGFGATIGVTMSF
jgi:outer membrane protein OmpU